MLLTTAFTALAGHKKTPVSALAAYRRRHPQDGAGCVSHSDQSRAGRGPKRTKRGTKRTKIAEGGGANQPSVASTRHAGSSKTINVLHPTQLPLFLLNGLPAHEQVNSFVRLTPGENGNFHPLTSSRRRFSTAITWQRWSCAGIGT